MWLKGTCAELIRESTGQDPDRRLIRDITVGPELRGVRLREYLEILVHGKHGSNSNRGRVFSVTTRQTGETRYQPKNPFDRI